MLSEIVSESAGQGPLLLITHGDVLAQWVEVSTQMTVLDCEYCGWVVSCCPGESVETPTPRAYVTVTEHGVSSRLLQPDEPLQKDNSSSAPKDCDVEVEFAEDRIGMVLVGVGEDGKDLDDGDQPSRYVEVADVVPGTPASRHPQVEGMVLKAIGGQSVLGLSTNATTDLLQQAERPVKIVLGPIPAPSHHFSLEPDQLKQLGEQTRADSTAAHDGTPTPVIPSGWLEHYSGLPPGSPHSEVEPAEGIPPRQPRSASPRVDVETEALNLSPDADLQPTQQPEPAPGAQHAPTRQLQHVLDADEELTPTLPTMIEVLLYIPHCCRQVKMALNEWNASHKQTIRSEPEVGCHLRRCCIAT